MASEREEDWQKQSSLGMEEVRKLANLGYGVVEV